MTDRPISYKVSGIMLWMVCLLGAFAMGVVTNDTLRGRRENLPIAPADNQIGVAAKPEESKRAQVPTKTEVREERPVEVTKKPALVLEVVVDYDRPLKDAITAARYTHVAEEITEANFPPSDFEKGKKKVRFRILHLNERLLGWEAVSAVYAAGCRPATLRELIAFNQANSELQKELWLTALGAKWRTPHGKWVVVAADGHKSTISPIHDRRSLGLNFSDWEKSKFPRPYFIVGKGEYRQLEEGFGPWHQFLAVQEK